MKLAASEEMEAKHPVIYFRKNQAIVLVDMQGGCFFPSHTEVIYVPLPIKWFDVHSIFPSKTQMRI